MQENDACFAENLVPSPSNYGAKRRMLRRYDEALIVDIEVISVVSRASSSAEPPSRDAEPSPSKDTVAVADDDAAAREDQLKKEGIF